MRRSGQIVTFSIRASDTKACKLVDELKDYSIQKGVKFSYMMIEAMKLYKEKLETK